MFLKTVIALVVTLVIADPACCCAFKSHPQNACQTTQSCCSGKTDPSRKKNDAPCNCSTAQQKAAPEKDFFKADSGSVKLLPQPTAATEAHLPRIPEAADLLAKWPPGRLPVATIQTRLAGKCSFLI
jgi:hypothetical protein